MKGPLLAVEAFCWGLFLFLAAQAVALKAPLALVLAVCVALVCTGFFTIAEWATWLIARARWRRDRRSA